MVLKIVSVLVLFGVLAIGDRSFGKRMHKRQIYPYGRNNYANSYNQVKPRNAVVLLNKDGVVGNQDGPYGELYFSQQSPTSTVRINGTINNLPEGMHGMHVHTDGDLRQGCTSLSTHFNPFTLNHGNIRGSPRHFGDMGNIYSIGGTANVLLVVEANYLTLFGENSIIGRGLVVHQKIDDLGLANDEESKKTGNSGARIACGIIGVAK